jgi:putative hydrolase of the HAD superfamily
MGNDIEVIFFDLFFTLITHKYNDVRNENDVLKITKEEWEKYAEDDELYLERATGIEKNPKSIIENIIKKMDIKVSESEKEEILKLREDRFKRSLMEVDVTIINVLLDLKKDGKKLCLISNADIIDVMHWRESPLYDLFDDVIFSYEVGYLKPQSEIYEIALERMKTIPKKCVFVGDGGSDELKGANELGMKTILTGYLLKKEGKELDSIKNFADYYIDDFKEIISIINMLYRGESK